MNLMKPLEMVYDKVFHSHPGIVITFGLIIYISISNTMPNHFTVICGLQYIGLHLGVNCP